MPTGKKKPTVAAPAKTAVPTAPIKAAAQPQTAAPQAVAAPSLPINSLNDLTDSNIMQVISSEIDKGSNGCKAAFSRNYLSTVQKEFACWDTGKLEKASSTLGSFAGKQAANKKGYDMRGFMKEKGRDWARSQVDSEKSTYLTSEMSKIDSNAGLSDDEKKAAKEETDSVTEVRSMFLKKALYSSVKDDIVSRMRKEAADVCDSIYSDQESTLRDTVKKDLIEVYKKVYTNTYKKTNSAAAAFAKAAELVNAATATASEKAVKENSKSVGTYLMTKVASKRSEMIQKFGGKEGKEGADFSSVKKDDFTAVNDFIYDGKSKNMDDKKKDITDGVKTDDIQATNVSSGLRYFAKPIVYALPRTGDTIEASGVVRIPIPQSNAFISFRLDGEFERDDDDMITAKIKASVGAGGSAGIANIEGTLGGFIEVKGKTPDDIAMLLSYGFYRQARESKIIPHQMTDTLWGMGNKTGEGKTKEAEAHGAQMERKLFSGDSENSVTIGLEAGLNASIGNKTTAVSGEIEAGVSVGREYSKESFEKGKGKGRLGKIEPYKKFGQKSKGDIVENLSLQGSCEGGIVGGGFEAELGLRGFKPESASIKLKLELSNTIGMFGENSGEKAVKVISDIARYLKTVQKHIKTVYDAKKGKHATKSKDEIGMKSTAEIATLLTDIGESIKEVADAKGTLEEMIGNNHVGDKIAGSKNTMELSVTYEWEKGSKGSIDISLMNNKSLAFDGFFAGIELTQGRKMAGWNTGKDFKNLVGMVKGKTAKEKLDAFKEGGTLL